MPQFALISTSIGDELIPSEDKIVAFSEDRAKLESLKDERAKERKEWLDKHGRSIQWWQRCSIISSERTEEVESP
jgi:hypothetical protein